MRRWIVAAAATALLWPGTAGAAAPTPEQMAQSVAQALKASGKLQGYAVGVKYEDGVAWLEGRVTSAQQSAIAAELASQVDGVSHVVNKLKVVSPSGSAPVAAAVKAPAKELVQATLVQTTMEQPAPLPVEPEALTAAPLPAPVAAPVATPVASRGMPRPFARTAGVQANMPSQGVEAAQYGAGYAGGVPQGYSTAGTQGVSYDQANMPGYAWPSYAAHPNYAAVSYPQQYSPAAWPYIGPFYPYPQVPLGWRKVTMEWDDGWWFLDFSHQETH